METRTFFGLTLALALLVTLGGTVGASTAPGTSAQDSVRNVNTTGPSPISMPNYWSYYLGDDDGTWGGTSDHAHSGDYSAFLQTRSYGSNGSVNVGLIAGKSDGYSGPEAYPIQASTTYSFSFWSRGDLQGAQPYALVWTSDEANSSERQWVSLADPISPSGDWTHHEGSFTTSADARKFVVMFKAIGDSSQVSLGTLYVDDLEVRLNGGANTIQNPGAEESVLRSGQVVIWDTNKKYDYKHYGFEAIKDRDLWTQVPYGTTGYTFAGDAVIQSDYYWVSLHSSPYDAVFLYANVDGHDSRHNELYRSWDTPNGCRNYGHGSSLNTIIKNEADEVIIESAAIPRERCGYTATVTTRYRALAGRAWLEISPVSQASEQGMHGESRFNVSPDLPSDGSDAVVDSLRHGLGGDGERVYMPDESEMLLDFVMDADLIWQMTWPTPAHERARSDTAAGGYNAGWSYVGEGDCERVITSPFIRYGDEKVIIGVHYKDYWHYQKIGQSVQAGVAYAGSWQRAYERALPHGLYPVGSPWTPGYPGQWRLVGSVDGSYYVNEVTITDTSDDTFTFVSPVDGTLEYVVMYLYDRTEGTPDDVTTPMDVYREAIAAPEVVSVAPTGMFVPLPPTFSIIFSEPMSRTITEGAISISGGMLPTGFAWSDGDRTVNFSSSASLIYATTYTVTVSTDAADQEGNHLSAPYSWQFTTRPEVMWQVYLPLVWKDFDEKDHLAREDRASSNDEALLAPTFGAEPNPTGNPIGGGSGYSDIIDPSQANYTVTNKSELLYALADVQANARDAWGSNNGVIHGAAWVDGKIGKALHFDGTDDYVDCGHDPSLKPQQGTIAFWMKSDVLDGPRDIINIFEDGYENYLLIRTSDDKIYVRVEDGDVGQVSLTSIETITTTSYHHIAITQDGSGVKIFIDGAESGASGTNSGYWTAHLDLTGVWIGGGHWSHFDGVIDQVTIYDRALTEAEIQQNHAGADIVTDGLVSWWTFDQDPAITARIVYVADDAEIDLTGEQDIVIPISVTLASGRGRNGSPGALIYSDELDTFPLFLTGGEGVRLTGLRLRGPDPERRESAYELPNSRGIQSEYSDLEVDNCELSAWSHCAVCLWDGTGHYIHHNDMHHNQRSGLGYGVCLDVAEALIEANLFDWNRHAIAGTGRPGSGYEARYNIVLENANGHSFDMHGGADRGDGTDIAGNWIRIHHNTFRATTVSAVVIRGIPTEGAWIHDNWFLHTCGYSAVRQTNAYGNMDVYDNVYGPHPFPPDPHDIRGQWPLDEGEGTVANDSSAYGNHGTLMNMDPATAWVDGQTGKALQFDGVDNYVDFGDETSLNLTDTMVLDLWVRFDSFDPWVSLVDNGLYRLFYRGEWAGNTLYFLYRIAEEDSPGDSGWSYWAGVSTCTELEAGRWYHIVGVKYGDRMAIYVDGVEEQELYCLTGYTVDDSEIGNLIVGQDFDGALDEIEIYEAEIHRVYLPITLKGPFQTNHEERKVNKMTLVKCLACFTLLFAGITAPSETNAAHSATVNAAPCQIQTYTDSDFTALETTFSDGAQVYVTVTDGVTTGGSKTITVTNNETPPKEITVEISDDGLYYDETAGDGIYSGMFIVTTKLTLSPDRGPSPEYPDDGLCHKIVKNIHIDDQDTALIEADLDGGGFEESKSIGLITLFNVEATAIKDTSVTIFWNTSDSGYSRVDYGLDSSYGQTVVQETNIKDLRLAHTVVLTDLAPNTTYHHQVTSRDTYGNSRSSGDYIFTTLTPEALDSAIRAARSSGDLPQTYYVKTGGDDSDDGLSIDTAWQHPSHAVEQAEAGDTIYLIEGTWYDEHLVFANSGIDVAPITLTTYDGGMSILDGVDKTGFGIRLRGGKSYIEISGVRLKNYYNAMYLQDQLGNITMHNFVVENTQRTGITFSGSEKISNISFSNFEIYETGIDGGYAALSYGGATNFEDVEIYDFEIYDTYGSGVYWRYVDRLHVNDGIIHDVAGSDGVSFSLNTYNSVMENLTVHHADWHGVAVHDWTVGKNPCFNNVIRDCHISYASHNHIDLHSGAYNTLVENNTLHDELAYCTGIYFHNRGAGLIARDNEIYNMHNGVSGGGYDEFPLHDMFIQDNVIHNCDNGIDQGELDITVSGNHLYDNTNAYGVVHLRGSGMVIDDNDISGETYRIDYGDGVVRNARDVTYTIRSAYGSSLTLEYTGGRVYAQDLTYHSGPYTLTEPKWYPDGSRTQMTSTTGENGIVVNVTAYPMTAVPSADEATVTVNKFDTSLPVREVIVDFTADSTDEITVTFTISDLTPYEDHQVNRDGSPFATLTASDQGSFQFSNSDWYTACTFTITQATTKPTVTSHSPSGIFVPLPPTFSITFSEPMSRTATEGAISISGGMSPTGFAWSDGDRTVNFVSSASLIYATTYTVTVSTTATDLEGEHLPVPHSWQFTTRPEVLWQVYLPLVTKEFHNPIWQQDGGRLLAHSSPQVIIWDMMKEYTDKWPFNQALDDRANWQQVPYGVTDYDFVGDAMIESDPLYLFLFSNDEDSPCLAAKLADDRVWTNEIYKVHDTGYRNFGMGNMWVKIVKNTPEEVIVESAEQGLRFGPPPIPITTFYRIAAGKPWLEVKPSANVNQQGQHDKRRLAGFLFEDVSQDVILDAKKHDQFEENVYPEQGCRGILIFHRAYNPASVDYDFMWFMTYPPGAEQNQLTYAGIHYPDPYWEWDCKPCAPSVGATYVYLEEKVIIGALNSQDNWKREDIGQPISAGETYTSAFTAPYAGKWRVAAAFSDDDWYVTEYLSEVIVNAGDHFTFTSPRGGTLDYLVIYMYDRTGSTPAEVTTPMDIYRETIAAPQVVSAAPTGIFVPLTPTLSITFSEPMSRTVTEGAIAISSGITPTNFAWSADDDTVNFVPSASLIYATTYTVTVSTAAADQEGDHLSASYSWSFTTRPEVMWQVYLPLVMKSFH